jgi:hypothetical protein
MTPAKAPIPLSHELEAQMSQKMKRIPIFKAIGPAVLVALGVAGMLGTLGAQAQSSDELLRIQQGLAIAPVPLTMAGLDPNLVGLGSYLVNAVGDCNGCHTGGGPPNFDYAAGGNPYFGQPKKVDPTVYLSGGQDFGPVGPPDNSGPDIIARNLTPDKTGLPAGGHTLSEFMQIIRNGTDYDHLHPTCTATSPVPTPANCIPAPVRGDLLQIMPWPTFSNMSDHDILAMYTYLSAIPCIQGPADPNDPLHNDCGSGTITRTNAIVTPLSLTTSQSSVVLDASGSTSGSGSLQYLFMVVSGGKQPALLQTSGNPKATVQFVNGPGLYLVQLIVTDARGVTSTSPVIMLTYQPAATTSASQNLGRPLSRGRSRLISGRHGASSSQISTETQ